MRLWLWDIDIKRRGEPSLQERVLELEHALELVRKQTEATRRKVYREEENLLGGDGELKVPEVIRDVFQVIRPGDPPGPG